MKKLLTCFLVLALLVMIAAVGVLGANAPPDIGNADIASLITVSAPDAVAVPSTNTPIAAVRVELLMAAVAVIGAALLSTATACRNARDAIILTATRCVKAIARSYRQRAWGLPLIKPLRC